MDRLCLGAGAMHPFMPHGQHSSIEALDAASLHVASVFPDLQPEECSRTCAFPDTQIEDMVATSHSKAYILTIVSLRAPHIHK